MDEEKEEGALSPKRPPENSSSDDEREEKRREELLKQMEDSSSDDENSSLEDEKWKKQREEARRRILEEESIKRLDELESELEMFRRFYERKKRREGKEKRREDSPYSPQASIFQIIKELESELALKRSWELESDLEFERYLEKEKRQEERKKQREEDKKWQEEFLKQREACVLPPHHKSDQRRSVSDRKFFTGGVRSIPELWIREDSAPVRRVLTDVVGGQPSIEWENRIEVLRDIQTLGPEATEAYQNALEAGKVKVYRAQIMLIGQDRAGKTSLKRSLLGLPFDPYQQSTDGIEVDPSRFEIGVEQVQNWQPIDKKTGTFLFANHLLRIMAGELSGKITEANLDVQKRPEEKSSEHDKAPPKKASHGESNTEALEPDMTELKIDPALPPTEFINPLVEKLKGLKPPTDSSQHITLEIWDFAGQHLYYASYPIFLSPRAVYLLIYNLSKGLKDTAQPCVRQGALDIPLINPNEETNLERLLSWLVTVSTMCSTQSNMDEKKREDLPYNRPPIFIVGTHADKPFQDIKQVESEIQKEISEMEYVGHVIRPFYYIDNTQGCSGDGVGALKKKLLEILKQEPYMGEELPLRWFNFERVVQALVAKEVYFLKLGALHTIIQKFCKIDSEIEVAAMLDFYHKLRVIVKHNETVVLQTQWLINVFKQLITIRPFNDMEPKHQKLWNEMKATGILRMELVNHVFSKICQESVIKEDILNMMEMFGLIAKFKTSSSDAIYFVPAQLNSPPGRLREMKPSPSDPCALYFLFPSGFVPYGLFSQLSSRCTKWCSENKFNKQPHFFDGVARFFIEKKLNYQLIIFSRKRYLKVLLKQTKSDCKVPVAEMEQVASFVRCFLENALNELSGDLPWLNNLKYELCVACPYCPEEKTLCRNHGQVCCTHDDCLCLLEVKPGGQLPFCRNCCCDESLTVPGLEKWFSATNGPHDSKSSTDNTVSRRTLSNERRSNPRGSSSTPSVHCLLPGESQGEKGARGSPGIDGTERVAGPSGETGEKGELGLRRMDENPTLADTSRGHPEQPVKEGFPSRDELERLSLKIGNTWRKLGRRLNFDEADLEGFDHDKSQLSEKALVMLRKWTQKEGSKATYRVLFHALCHEFVNCKDLAEEICCVTQL